MAIDAINDQRPDSRVDDFETISIAESLPVLIEVYPEISELAVDHRGFVRLDGTNSDWHTIKAYGHLY